VIYPALGSGLELGQALGICRRVRLVKGSGLWRVRLRKVRLIFFLKQRKL